MSTPHEPVGRTEYVVNLERERDNALAQAAAYKADFEAELAGNKAIREKYGARDGETMADFHARMVRERDEALIAVRDLETVLLGQGAVETTANRRVAAALRDKIEADAAASRGWQMADSLHLSVRQMRERAERAEKALADATKAGRFEGQADVKVAVRQIVDPEDKNHWNLDGVLKEVQRLTLRVDALEQGVHTACGHKHPEGTGCILETARLVRERTAERDAALEDARRLRIDLAFTISRKETEKAETAKSQRAACEHYLRTLAGNIADDGGDLVVATSLHRAADRVEDTPLVTDEEKP